MKRKVTWTTREFKKMLRENGYELVRSKGDHFTFKKGSDTITINNRINVMVARRLIKERAHMLNIA